MNPFPGPKSILVMDNASWHHGQEIRDACDLVGIKLIYLPAYSPDFNPIEAFFGDLKKFIRREARWKNNDFADEVAFARWLQDCIDVVSGKKDAIRNHFRHALVPGVPAEAGRPPAGNKRRSGAAGTNGTVVAGGVVAGNCPEKELEATDLPLTPFLEGVNWYPNYMAMGKTAVSNNNTGLWCSGSTLC